MKTVILVHGVEYPIDYEVHNLTDTNFDLTIYYEGKEMKERCPRYLADFQEDVIAPHGPLLLEKLLNHKTEQLGGGSRDDR